MIERHLLRYFLAVVDTGTFSQAAVRCGVSQPTVSSGIARLEEATGELLFQRSSRRVELTRAGARLLPHARSIEVEFLKAQNAVSSVTPSALVRIGVAGTVATDMLERMVAACIRNQDCRIEIVERRPSELKSLLDRARVDAVLGPLEKSANLEVIEVLSEPYLLAMSDAHRLAQLDSVTCEQIADETMLVRRQCEALSRVSQFFTARGVRPFMAARSANDDLIISYVRAGLGITVMPQSLARPGIVTRPLEEFKQSRTISLGFDPASRERLFRTGIADRILAELGTGIGSIPLQQAINID